MPFIAHAESWAHKNWVVNSFAHTEHGALKRAMRMPLSVQSTGRTTSSLCHLAPSSGKRMCHAQKKDERATRKCQSIPALPVSVQGHAVMFLLTSVAPSCVYNLLQPTTHVSAVTNNVSNCLQLELHNSAVTNNCLQLELHISAGTNNVSNYLQPTTHISAVTNNVSNCLQLGLHIRLAPCSVAQHCRSCQQHTHTHIICKCGACAEAVSHTGLSP